MPFSCLDGRRRHVIYREFNTGKPSVRDFNRPTPHSPFSKKNRGGGGSFRRSLRPATRKEEKFGKILIFSFPSFPSFFWPPLLLENLNGSIKIRTPYAELFSSNCTYRSTLWFSERIFEAAISRFFSFRK